MQEASVNFSEVMSAGAVTFVPPKIMADWSEDGYGVAHNTLAPTLFHDDFAREATSSWGSSADGRAWTNFGEAASAYSVTGSAGRHSVPAAFVNLRSWVEHGGGDLDYVVSFIPYSLALGNEYRAGVLIRHQSITDHYVFWVRFNTNNTISIDLNKVVGASESAIDSVTTGITHIANTEYSVRVQVSGSTLRAKLWIPATKIEPVDWDITITDTTFTAGGQVGVRSFTGSGNTNPKPLIIDYTDFRVVDGGLVDDLSHLVGGPFEVSHVLDDGFPDSVSFVAGLGTAELAVPLVGGRDGKRMSEYFSPFNQNSPFYGFDRDVAPVKYEVGVVTDSGPEYVRVFTGQMAEVPVKTGEASLKAMSGARLKMATMIRPPVVNGIRAGANATWLISYAMFKSGIYVAPPPESEADPEGDNVEWYAPMHGSLQPFIPDTNQITTLWQSALFWGSRWETGGLIDEFYRPTFIDGPFSLAPNAKMTLDEAIYNTATPKFIGTNHFVSQYGNSGRLELWIRGDATNKTNFEAENFTPSKLAGMRFENSNGTTVEAGVGQDQADRKVYVQIFDGTRTLTLRSTSSLPSDGEWYFCGAAWDFEANKVWVNFNGTVQSSTSSPAIVATGLPVFDTPANASVPNYIAYIPAAEVRLTAGEAVANPDQNPVWANTQVWTSGANLRPSQIEFETIAESVEREAWSVVGDIALSELATMRTDEHDIVQYLDRSYWIEDAQASVVDALSTKKNVQDLVVDFDPSKIRNSVSVKYSERVVLATNFVLDTTAADSTLIPPGITDMVFRMDRLAAFVSGSRLVAAANNGLYNAVAAYLTANREKDGTGVYATTLQIYADPIAWDAQTVTLRFVNVSGPWYLANDLNIPALGVLGNAVSIHDGTATKRIEDSIARRGERSLIVDLPEIQKHADAKRVANRLAYDLAYPIPTLGEVTVFGDPRRQPGDLVTFEDAADTQADGEWRVSSVVHSVDGPEYVQKVRVQRHLTPTIGVWGVTRWGRSVWAEGD